MADNITSPAAAGTILKTDNIGGVNYQEVKLVVGAHGADGGDVNSANPLPVSAQLTYTAADPSYTSGTATIPLRADQKGALLVNSTTAGAGDDYNNQVVATVDRPVSSAAYSPTRYQTPTTPVLLDVIKNATGSIQAVNINNFGATLAYFQVHNINAAPSSNASWLAAWPVAAGTATNPGVLTLTKGSLGGVLFGSLGLAYAFSTGYRSFVQTGLTAANFYEDISYI